MILSERCVDIVRQASRKRCQLARVGGESCALGIRGQPARPCCNPALFRGASVIGAIPNPGAARVRTRVNPWSVVAMAFRVVAAAALCLVTVAAHAQTLASVRERGRLSCGVNPGLLGFASRDDKGNWAGFDVDFCRALSAAIFNDPAKVEIVPLTNEQRLPAVKAREVDVLSRNT